LVTNELSAKANSSSRMLSLTVEKSLRNAMMKRRRDEVSAIISSVVELPDIRRMAVLDEYGRTVLESPAGPRVKTDKQVQEMARIATRSGRWVSRDMQGDILRAVSPIRNEKRCWSCHGSSRSYLGHLLIEQSTRADRFALARNRETIIAGGITALLITVITLLLMLSRLVHQPISQLMATMMRIEEGDISARADTSAGDELRRLSEALNAMVTSLEQRNADIVKAQQCLLEARRLATVGLLAAGMAHEIGNPTGAIVVASEGLARHVPSDGDAAKLLGLIQRSSERIGSLVSDLLRFDPKQPISCSSVDLNALLKSAVDSAADALAGPEHRISLALDANTEGVVGDNERLRQAFTNVVVNAFEAMPSGGTLTVITTSDEAQVDVAISDTGTGISEDDLPLVTTPFFTRKEPGKGRGLGLAIAREIIAQHSGELTLSAKLNQGVTARICIPKQRNG